MHEDPETYLLNCFDFEREKFSRRKNKPFTLERVQRALKLSDHPEKNLNVIHIAGTKGKGSTLEYIYHGMKLNGVKQIGLFTSPHFESLCERIRIDDQNIPILVFKNLAEEVTNLNTNKFDGALSFFECLFLMALLYFKQEHVKHVILETGLGGRLDATNSIRSSLSVLTRIDYDHTEILGDTLAKIAAEKAGIIKPNGKVIALKQSEQVNQVFERFSRDCEAELTWVESKVEHENNVIPSVWENSHLAHAVVKSIFPDTSLSIEAYINHPLKGRLQHYRHNGQEFLLDGAHNQVALRNLKTYLKKLNQPIQCAFAMADSREASELLQALCDHCIEEFIFFELPGGRPGIAPETCQNSLAQHSPDHSSRIETSLDEWLNTHFEGIKLVTGSIYLVGEVMKLIRRQLNPS